MAVPIVRAGDEALGGDLMPRDIAGFIFERTERMSAIMQLAPREELPTTGKTIPVVTGRPTASWTSEAGRKGVSDMTVGTKTMDPKKLTVIVPFSKEYLRDNRINLLGMLRPKIAEAFAMAFDAATLHGTSTPFTTFIGQTTNQIALGTATQADGGYHADLTGVIAQTVGGPNAGKGYRHNGWAFDTVAEPTLLSSYDANGRPLMVDSATSQGTVPNLVGRRVSYYDNVAASSILGFGGDWAQARYGVASDITYSMSSEASIELADTSVLHLWQDNLVALLAEAEYGFIVNDVQAFSEIHAEGTVLPA